MTDDEAIKIADNAIKSEFFKRCNIDYKLAEALGIVVGLAESKKDDVWISVKERLPVKAGRCLVFTDYGDVTMDSFVDGMFVCNLGNVTHWRPLPKAPESEDEK